MQENGLLGHLSSSPSGRKVDCFFMLMNMVAGACVVVSCVGIVGGNLLVLMLLEQMYYI